MSNEPQPSGRTARAIGLVVTNATKLAGVAIALNEAFAHPQPRPTLVGVAALMIAGAQGVERFLDKLFGS